MLDKAVKLVEEIIDGYCPCQRPDLCHCQEKLAKAALVELNTFIESNGWQDIETAPKDGTYILVYGAPVFSKSCVAQWTRPRTGDDWNWYTPEISIAINPTHWQPLPAIKSIKEQDNG